MTPRARCCRARLSTVFVIFLCVAFLLLLLGYLSGFGSVVRNDLAEQTDGQMDTSHGQQYKVRKPNNKWDQMFGQQQKEEVIVCKQPKFGFTAPRNEKVKPLDCKKKPELMSVSNNVVMFDKDVLRGKKLAKCLYRGIDWLTDDHFQYTKPHVETDPTDMEKRVNHDFFRVQCNRDTGKKQKPVEEDEYDEAGNDDADYDQLFAQIYPSEETLERLGETIPSPESLNMSVFILGLESMSHLSYQRNLPKTYEFLKKTLGAVILNGYNILGDGTAATVVPLLTGNSVPELPEVRRNQPESGFVDEYPFIWVDFEHNGYVTLFAEDEPSLGMFNLRQRGFENEPTDHYMRPFWQAVWDSSINRNSERFCLGGRPKHQYTLNYIKEFFEKDKYKDTPKFAFGFHGELSHANNDPIKYLDKDLVLFLRHLNTNGHLDNTMLIVMGDHGARYRKVRRTTQGKLEERLPLMSITMPKWFQQKYPKAMANLKTNAKRLTTAYDVHETMRDLMDKERMDERLNHEHRGISLFKEIPRNRTCESSGIQMHWCTCLSWSDVPTSDVRIQESAAAVMDYIKRQIDDFKQKCAPLKLKEIVDGRRIMPNEKVLKYFNSLDNDHRLPNFTKEMKIDVEYYQVQLITSPNNGYYEATILYDKRGWMPAALSSPYQVVSDISRVDPYGTQPYCIQDERPELMKYCFCPDYKSKLSDRTSRKPKFFLPDKDWIS